ncbi:MAG: VOC family protein [Candidatus Baltobacteraceae bacterium]
MLRTTPFLLFDGDCAEAMTFYRESLGGELTLTKLGDTAMKDMFPKEKWDRIINAKLKRGPIEISAADWMASPQYEPRHGNTAAIFVLGEGYDELRAVFDKLAEGAQKDRFQDLHDLPFGTYGQLCDKYNVHWKFKGDKR